MPHPLPNVVQGPAGANSWLVQAKTATSGGIPSITQVYGAITPAVTTVKSTAGQIYALDLVNNASSTWAYLHIFITSPTLGTTAATLTYGIAPNSARSISFGNVGLQIGGDLRLDQFGPGTGRQHGDGGGKYGHRGVPIQLITRRGEGIGHDNHLQLARVDQRDLSLDARLFRHRFGLCGGVVRDPYAGAHHARRSRSSGLSMGDGRQFGRRRHIRPYNQSVRPPSPTMCSTLPIIGAKCDGSTDDDAAINATILAAY